MHRWLELTDNSAIFSIVISAYIFGYFVGRVLSVYAAFIIIYCRSVAINTLLVANGVLIITSSNCLQFAVNMLLIADDKLIIQVVVKLLSQIIFL